MRKSTNFPHIKKWRVLSSKYFRTLTDLNVESFSKFPKYLRKLVNNILKLPRYTVTILRSYWGLSNDEKTSLKISCYSPQRCGGRLSKVHGW